ncbi:MAG: hypothetical protein KGI75_31925, partial [Rhizobiaceae bacterium]|nr:hypothetical protein [Rhizobiaceae bacterium]
IRPAPLRRDERSKSGKALQPLNCGGWLSSAGSPFLRARNLQIRNRELNALFNERSPANDRASMQECRAGASRHDTEDYFSISA